MMITWCRKATVFTRQTILSCSHFSHTLNAKVSYIHGEPQFLFPRHAYTTESAYRDERVDLEIISREFIKPTSPTPNHLRTLSLSAIDQVTLGYYTSLILFFPNTDKTCVSDVGKVRSRCLKESLPKLLTKYYPFAGEITNNIHIDCNDKGVYFVEARVNQTLEQFLGQPDDVKVRELNPKHPSTTQSSLGSYIISVQVNIFNCGGIGISTNLSHKIVDGQTYFMFIKAWAAVANGLHPISPSFVASKVFPSIPNLESLSPPFMSSKLYTTKRFVFDSKALDSLRAQPVSCPSGKTMPIRGPTRTEAISALIWKAAAKATLTQSQPHTMMMLVNIRKRALPPFPEESIGNIADVAVGICFPNKQPNLSTLMGEIRESIARINSDHIESQKGEEGHRKFMELFRMIKDTKNMIDKGGNESILVTSILNNGMYEIDFGWGKPIWFYYMNPGWPSVACLNDVIKGGGVEAIVTLSVQEMEIFERDSDILSYATFNPSPLLLI